MCKKITIVRKFCRETRCSLENLHSWKIFYTTNGRDGHNNFKSAWVLVVHDDNDDGDGGGDEGD